MGITIAIWEKWIEFKHDFIRITVSSLISPLLYLVAFGWGIGSHTTVNGHPYILFLIPGIVALTTMNTSFSAAGVSLNVQRLYEHSFDQIIISPTPLWQYIAGQVIGGALRGVYSGTLILIISLFFSVNIHINVMFFLVMLLNGMVFAALGVFAAVIGRTHADVARFSTFVITPMSFLCNTFFSLDKIPHGLKEFIYYLPLSHSSNALRCISYGEACPLVSILILFGYCALFLYISYRVVLKKKNL